MTRENALLPSVAGQSRFEEVQPVHRWFVRTLRFRRSAAGRPAMFGARRLAGFLHFEEYDGALPDYAAAARRLKRHVRHYAKASIAFDDYREGLADARARAERRCEHECEHQRNPSSGVWRLVDVMDGRPG